MNKPIIELNQDNYDVLFKNITADKKRAERAAAKSNRRAKEIRKKMVEQSKGAYRYDKNGKRYRVTKIPTPGA